MEKTTVKGMKFSKEKLKNIWFYYKWYILAGIFMLVLGSLLITQCVTKEDHEVYVYYAGGSYFSPEMQDKMEDALYAVLPEDLTDSVGFFYTKIGKVQNMDDLKPGDGLDDDKQQDATDALAYQQAVQDFTARMHQQQTVICLLEPEYFEVAVEEGWLSPLSSCLEDLPDGVKQSDYGIPLGSLPLYKSDSIFKNLPENTMLCFTVEAPAIVRTGDRYELQKDVFEELVAFGQQD
jgi:hypothetical protein